MYDKSPFFRLFAALVGVGLTAVGLTVATADADPAGASSAIVDVYFQRQGALDDGESAFHRVWLTAGRTYRFQATCDIDCSDVDLLLRDASADKVAEDTLPDDVPIIVFTPVRSGSYRLEIRMYACSREPCAYELGGESW